MKTLHDAVRIVTERIKVPSAGSHAAYLKQLGAAAPDRRCLWCEARWRATESGCTHSWPARISWARLLERMFEIDMALCPNCGSPLRSIAAILKAPVIERILTHLGP